MLSNEVLNEKIARWLGFYKSGSQWLLKQGVRGLTDIVYAEKILPDFINSLDAQSKWIIPNIKDLKYYAFWPVHLTDGDYWDCHLATYEHFYSGRALNNQVLAFVLACEKLIDNLGAKNAKN
jgi:hypothetical protein